MTWANLCWPFNKCQLDFRAIKIIQNSENSFKNTHELLKNAIFLKQQLKYEDSRRRPNSSSNQNSSVYKRLSAHLQTTLDLSELDFSGVMRETTHRVENIMSHARNGSPNASMTRASSASSNSGSTDLQRSHTTLHWIELIS